MCCIAATERFRACETGRGNKYKMVVAKEITVMMEKVINAKNPKRPV